MAKVQEQGKVGFKQAIADFWKGYVGFTGRTTRAGYWWQFLFNALIIVPLVILFTICAFWSIYTQSVAAFYLMLMFAFLLVIYGLAIMIPTLAVTTRRMNDLGLDFKFSIAIVIALCVPIVCWVAYVAVFVLALLPTNQLKKA